jgi:hypothetical protein
VWTVLAALVAVAFLLTVTDAGVRQVVLRVFRR